MSLHNRTVLVVSTLVLIAALTRLVNLGALSFYADEETSAMPARSMAEGNGPRMPTGMEYRRALPLTWANSVTARLVGVDNEVAYRLPTALLGILTVPLLFWVGRSLGAGRVAMVAALLLAFSEWHLVFSRQARMYVPFLLFFIAAAWAIWNWSETGRRRWLLAAVPLVAGALAMHKLGLMIVMFAILPLVLPGHHRVPMSRLVALAVSIALAGWVYHEYFVEAPYRGWSAPILATIPAADGAAETTEQSAGGLSRLFIVLGIMGAGVGLSVAAAVKHSIRHAPLLGQAALLLTAMATGALAWTGQLYGACMAGLVFLLLLPGSKSSLFRRILVPLALVALPALVWLALAFLGQGLREGLKSLSTFPYPYPLYLAYQFPVILGLFGGVCLAIALRETTQADRPLRATILAGLLPVLAVGAVSRWGGTRYLFAAYPFILLAASLGLVWLIDWVGSRFTKWGENGTPALAAVVVLSGALGGHGLPQMLRVVTLEHGESVNEAVHMYPFRPDHKEVGRYVRDNRSGLDVVIAEDPLQQWWYAGGPIDYWLRSYRDSRAFLYSAAEGDLRDIYVGSRLLAEPRDQEDLLAAPGGRVWLITSGETYSGRSYYLSATQAQWLDSLETAREPMFVGRDGVSRVYCLNCTHED